MARFPLVFEYFGLWQCRLQVPTGDIVFSDDAQVPYLSQWLFLAFGMELLLVAFSVLEDLWIIMHHTIFEKPPICEGLYTSHVYFSNHEHKLLGMFVFSLNHSLREKACV